MHDQRTRLHSACPTSGRVPAAAASGAAWWSRQARRPEVRGDEGRSRRPARRARPGIRRRRVPRRPPRPLPPAPGAGAASVLSASNAAWRAASATAGNGGCDRPGLLHELGRGGRGGLDHGQHRALDRHRHRGPRRVIRPGQRSRERRRVDMPAAPERSRSARRPCPAAAAPGSCPSSRARPQGPRRPARPTPPPRWRPPPSFREIRGRRVEPFAGRVEGEIEVRAGVAVRDREDVEGVDLLAGPAERGQTGPGPGAHRGPVDGFEHEAGLSLLTGGTTYAAGGGSRPRDPMPASIGCCPP